MNESQKKYLETTPGYKVTLQGWVELSTEVSEKEINKQWREFMSDMSEAKEQEKIETYRRLSKMASSNIKTTISKVVAENKHLRRLLPSARQNEVAAATVQANSIQNRLEKQKLLKNQSSTVVNDGTWVTPKRRRLSSNTTQENNTQTTSEDLEPDVSSELPLLDNNNDNFSFQPPESMYARFHKKENLNELKLSEPNLSIFNSARDWLKKVISGSDIDSTLKTMVQDPFEITWAHDMLYDRMKLLKKGFNAVYDENSYTCLWVVPDLSSLYINLDLVQAAYFNENHFPPSSWRRSWSRDVPHAKGTNVDGYFLAVDGYVDLILENVGNPTTGDFSKFEEDTAKCFRNSADALLQRFYNMNGSYDIAKEYAIISMVIFGKEVHLFTTKIAGRNNYLVEKVMQFKYHTSKDTGLIQILSHLRLALTIKTIMENNQLVRTRFDESCYCDLRTEEQVHFMLAKHVTPTSKIHRKVSWDIFRSSREMSPTHENHSK